MSSSCDVYSFEEVAEQYNPDTNITSPIMTKYEIAKLLGQRMEQLARGAPSLVDASKAELDGLVTHEKFRRLVELEIKQRVLPFMIGRTLPNGKKEYWKLTDMIIPGY